MSETGKEREAAPSHDPRTWLRPAADSARAPPDAAPEPGRNAGLTGRRVLIGAGAAGAAAALGLGGLLLTRGRSAPAPAVTRDGPERRTFELDAPLELRAALISNHIPQADIAPVLAGAAGLRAGAPVRVEMQWGPSDPGVRSLLSLRAEHADGAGVQLERSAGRWVARPLAAAAQISVKAIRGEIDQQSFYTSAVRAGVDDRLIPELVRTLAFDFDFVREIRPGDVFEVVFEQPVNRFGRPIGLGTLLYVALTTSARASASYRWRRPGAPEAAWFDAEGRSIVRSLMRTPVDGARVTSTFGLRLHPVLGFVRAHKGVDFGAPVGTPVYASGDGVVGFVGVHGGHGNYIRIDHSRTLSTAYAHLSAFSPASKVNASVRQGQVIGLSGNTGLSDGPHLHYEVIVGGEQVDPLTYRAAAGQSLSGAELAAFLKERLRIDRLRHA